MSSGVLTAVIVPGAWHAPGHYAFLDTLLQQAGYIVVTLSLPSVDSAAPLSSDVAGDSAWVRNRLLPLVDAGRHVLLIMHSYGSCPGAAAAKGFSIRERKQQQLNGGVVGLVFIAGVLIDEGRCLLDGLGGDWDTWHVPNEAAGTLTPANPLHDFYGDVPVALAAQAIAALRPQAMKSFTSPSPPPAWADAAYTGLCAYAQCSQDNALPPAVQEMMLKLSKVEWVTRQFASSHSPFLSCPDALADFVISAAMKFGKT